MLMRFRASRTLGSVIVGAGGETLSYFELFHDFLRRQWLPKQFLIWQC
jgi:hypothetical protein